MNLPNKNKDDCPPLILAPMEGLGDASFRKAIASIGGFDEAVREFLRVPMGGCVQTLAKHYQADEISPFRLSPQIMGVDPHLMALMSVELEQRGASRIDLNCGCPSNTVTGKGAGSSLLKTPDKLYQLAKAMVQAVSIPVTVKLRSGFEDTSLFKENLLAAQESGIKFLTLHPRTKVEGYTPPARWELIAEAKSLLSIPVVGNGDILTIEDALKMLELTKCDALMIGRGAVINPFIFQEIKAHFSGKGELEDNKTLRSYLNVFISSLSKESVGRSKVNKLKQLLSYLFKRCPVLLERRQKMLTFQAEEFEDFLDFVYLQLD